ncbi:MAG: SoxR reducing system RseC family protein [Burkholderiales bacterium]|nr:SoxR reducing system RseC family protein [Burkholderiales bacterium]
MLESQALVVKIEHGATYVEAQAGGSCGSGNCSTSACSTAVLTRIFSQQPKALRVNNPIEAKVGEQVMLGLEEGAFLKSAFLAYLLPLVALIMGAMIGLWLAGPAGARDLYAGLGGLAGLIASAFGIKWLNPILFDKNRAQPVILRRL